MRHLGLALLLVIGFAEAAKAEDCLDKINEAVTRADALSPSPGRSAILTDIARARDARHEGDGDECIEQVEETLAILREHEESQLHPTASPAETPTKETPK